MVTKPVKMCEFETRIREQNTMKKTTMAVFGNKYRRDWHFVDISIKDNKYQQIYFIVYKTILLSLRFLEDCFVHN